MALPLPKVVPDIAPGGGIVTAMGGINALNNAMAEAEYNKIKAQLAPYSIGAQAASQMAYSRLMYPQFMAKLMANEGFLGNTTEEEKKNNLRMLQAAGNGAGTGNAYLDQAIRSAGDSSGISGLESMMIPERRFSLSRWAANKIRDLIDSSSSQKPKINALLQPMQPQVTGSAVNSMSSPYSQPQNHAGMVNENGEPVRPILNINDPRMLEAEKAYLNSVEGTDKIAETGDPNYKAPPEYLRNWYNRQLGFPQTNPIKMTLNTGNKAVPATEEGTYAENTGKYLGVTKQGEKLGEHRANAINDIGEQQAMLSNTGGNINRLIDDFTNADFMALRAQFPVLQDLQLKAAAHFRNPMVQNMVGNIIADLESFKQSTVMGFKGQTLKREFDFADKLKPSEKDTVYTALGKLQSLKALHDIAERKNSLISQYLQKDKMNLPEAIERANKAVDIRGIQNQVRQLTQPMHAIKNKKTGITIYLTSQRAKELGFDKPAKLATGK